MFNILTYNVEYGKQIGEIYKWIKSLENYPQIICFQEFPEKELANLEKYKIYKKQEFFFAEGLSSKNEVFGEFTIIDSSKINTNKTVYIDLGPDHLESIYKRNIIKRSAVINKFEMNGKKISIANVHLTPLSLHGKRKKQLLKVIENSTSEKSIILGDFNYSSLLTRGGLVTFMKSNHYNLAGVKLITNKYKYKIPQQLDYVFFKNLNHVKTEVFDLPHSDHFPVISEFKV